MHRKRELGVAVAKGECTVVTFIRVGVDAIAGISVHTADDAK
jgi:hypothetical protein